MLKWIVIIVGVLIAIPLVLGAIGLFLQKGHRASRTVTYSVPPAAVFAAISNIDAMPSWRSDIKGIERKPDDGKGVLYVEKGSQGDILFRIEVSEPNSRMRTRIADPKLPFGGTWTFELKPNGSGTELTITEDGEVYNPIFRVMQKFFFSPFKTIDTYQADLRKHLQS